MLEVQGKLIEPGSSVTTAVREKNALRQQFYEDDTTQTLRCVFRNYCIDIDAGEFWIQLYILTFGIKLSCVV